MMSVLSIKTLRFVKIDSTKCQNLLLSGMLNIYAVFFV